MAAVLGDRVHLNLFLVCFEREAEESVFGRGAVKWHGMKLFRSDVLLAQEEFDIEDMETRLKTNVARRAGFLFVVPKIMYDDISHGFEILVDCPKKKDITNTEKRKRLGCSCRHTCARPNFNVRRDSLLLYC